MPHPEVGVIEPAILSQVDAIGRHVRERELDRIANQVHETGGASGSEAVAGRSLELGLLVPSGCLEALHGSFDATPERAVKPLCLALFVPEARLTLGILRRALNEPGLQLCLIEGHIPHLSLGVSVLRAEWIQLLDHVEQLLGASAGQIRRRQSHGVALRAELVGVAEGVGRVPEGVVDVVGLHAARKAKVAQEMPHAGEARNKELLVDGVLIQRGGVAEGLEVAHESVGDDFRRCVPEVFGVRRDGHGNDADIGRAACDHGVLSVCTVKMRFSRAHRDRGVPRLKR